MLPDKYRRVVDFLNTSDGDQVKINDFVAFVVRSYAKDQMTTIHFGGGHAS